MYKPYFTIELTHSYFADGKCKGVRIVPDKLTHDILSRHKVLLRQVDNEIFFLVYSDAVANSVTDYVQFLPFDEDTVLRFAIIVDDYQFYNYTSIVHNVKSLKYFLSNKVENALSGTKYLSAPISPFEVSRYDAGDLCVSNVGGAKVYEATQVLLPVYAQAPDVNNTYEFIPSATQAASLFPEDTKDIGDYHWFLRGNANAYAALSSNDLLAFASKSYTAILNAPADEIFYSIHGYNPVTDDFDLIVVSEQRVFIQEPVMEYKISLADYAPGRYRIVTNGEAVDIILSNDSVFNSALGVVEICVNATGDYSLIDEDGVLLNPSYKVHFSNRLVFWKYKSSRSINATTGVGAIKFCNIGFNSLWQQPSGTVANDLLGTSLLPIPLFDKVIDDAQLVYPQANAPPLIYTTDPEDGIVPLQDVKLPIPQANSLNGLQIDTVEERFLASVNSLSF